MGRQAAISGDAFNTLRTAPLPHPPAGGGDSVLTLRLEQEAAPAGSVGEACSLSCLFKSRAADALPAACMAAQPLECS